MEYIKGYAIPQSILDRWSQIFVPDFDLFYFENKPDFLPFCKINEFDKSILTLDIRTSFLTWSIDKRAHYISKVSNEQYTALSSKTKEYIWREQKRFNRGLVFSKEEFWSLLKSINQREIHESLNLFEQVDEIITIQGYSWKKLSKELRNIILLNYAEDWIKEYALSKEDKEPFKHLNATVFPYIDSFPQLNGPNCLAAVAAAITNSITYIQLWMQPEQFMKLLKEKLFCEIKDKILQNSDVIVWFNTENVPIHAAYVLNNEFAFNKLGQTMFNPWQAIHINDLLESWKGYEFRIYRTQ